MDSFSSVASLSSTSRTFHNLWKSDAKFICDAVLQRTIECLPEAQLLLDAQESSQYAVEFLALHTSPEGHDAFQQAILRSQRLFFNDYAASWAFDYFGYEMYEVSELRRKMSPFERKPFVQAYYGAMTIVWLLGVRTMLWDETPKPLIASWDRLHFQRAGEFLNFLLKRFPDSGVLQNNIGVLPGNRSFDMMVENAIHEMYMMGVLDQGLLAGAPNGYFSKPPGVPKGYFIANEYLAKTTDSPGGVHLVDSLRLLPEGALLPEGDLLRTMHLEVAVQRHINLRRVSESDPVVQINLS